MKLRAASETDSELLLGWVNAPDSLKWKRQSREPIARAAHERWFRERLADPDSRIWLVETVDGAPAGQIRLQREDDVFSVDIYVEPGHRGKGIAGQALMEALRRWREQRGGVEIVAIVHEANAGSRALFERCGFSLEKTEDGWRRYSLSAGTMARETRRA